MTLFFFGWMISRLFVLGMDPVSTDPASGDWTLRGGTARPAATMDGGTGQPPAQMDGGTGQPPAQMDGGTGQPPARL